MSPSDIAEVSPMQTHSRHKSSPLPVADSAPAADPPRRTRERVRHLIGWATGGLAATAAAFLLAQAVSGDSKLTHELEAFRHRVTGGTAPATTESPAEALAPRYLQALDPAVRQRITDQVRGEQRAGMTAPGRSAFVLRRLELYEAALQRSRATPAGPLPARGAQSSERPKGATR